jgi:hypothetical protein
MPEQEFEKAQAGVDWFYVLTAPITKTRDKMMVLEIQGMDIAPAFASKDEGKAFLKRLAPPDDYAVQAMHIQDIREFMGAQKAAAALLDGEGRFLRALAGDPLPEAEAGGGTGTGDSPGGGGSGGDSPDGR